MPLAERQERWQGAWAAIEGATPAGWGRSFISSLLRASGGSVTVGAEVPLARTTLPALPASGAEGRGSARLN